jgi:hypothetical protein
MFDLLSTLPGNVYIGLAAGLIAVALFHWLAPAGIDTASAGAWLVGIGCVAGFVWPLLVKGPAE